MNVSGAIPPVKNLAIAAGIGAGVSVLMSGLTRGETPQPTIGGTIGSGIKNGVIWGGIGAAFTGFQTGWKGDMWKEAGVRNASYGVAFAAGSAVGNLVTSAVGF
jgi:hypothetical protein